jgi:hypothetical protein
MRRVMQDESLRARLATNASRRARMHPWDAIYQATQAELLAAARKHV